MDKDDGRRPRTGASCKDEFRPRRSKLLDEFSGFVLENGQMKVSPMRESERFINANRCVIIRERMQKRGVAVLLDLVHDSRHQRASVAASARIGMGADGADFDESWNTHALAGHRDQLPALEDAEEYAQLVRAISKGTRLGQLR